MSMKIPVGFLKKGIVKFFLIFIWEYKESRIAKTPLKKNKIGWVIESEFKTYFTAAIIKIV